MRSISNAEAAEARKKLIRYCEQTGCLYCEFCIMQGPDIECEVGRPREWRKENESL